MTRSEKDAYSLSDILFKLDEFETQEFMRLADLDGDGNVNYEEFVTMLFKKEVENMQAPMKMCLKPMDSSMVWSPPGYDGDDRQLPIYV